jgi:hypothetical protein
MQRYVRRFHTAAKFRAEPLQPHDVAPQTSSTQTNGPKSKLPSPLKDVKVWLGGVGIFVTWGMWYLFVRQRTDVKEEK